MSISQSIDNVADAFINLTLYIFQNSKLFLS